MARTKTIKEESEKPVRKRRTKAAEPETKTEQIENSDQKDEEIIYTVSVKSKLNVRYGPGYDNSIKYQIDDGEHVIISEIKDNWGKINDDEWVCMDFLVKE